MRKFSLKDALEWYLNDVGTDTQKPTALSGLKTVLKLVATVLLGTLETTNVGTMLDYGEEGMRASVTQEFMAQRNPTTDREKEKASKTAANYRALLSKLFHYFQNLIENSNLRRLLPKGLKS